MSDDVRFRVATALATGHPADEACREKLAAGALLVPPSQPVPVSSLIDIYRRRLRHLNSREINFVDEDVVDRIVTAGQAALRLVGLYGTHSYVVFLDPVKDDVVATIGVDGAAANAGYWASP